MKKLNSLLANAFAICFLLLMNHSLSAQVLSPTPSPFPENVNKIFTTSCMPCHTNTGGARAKDKLNFTEWAQYSTEIQKEKAEKIISEIKEGSMPPQMARDTRPETIPTKEQTDIIAKWSELFIKGEK